MLSNILSDESNSVRLDVLKADGSNLETWRFSIKLALTSRGLENCLVEEGVPCEMGSKQNALAMSIILSSLNERTKSLILDTQKAEELYRKILKIHQGTSAVSS